MGCGMSSEDKEGKQRNEQIENQLKKDKIMQRNEIKMLLLGTLSFRLALQLTLKTIQVPVNLASQLSSNR